MCVYIYIYIYKYIHIYIYIYITTILSPRTGQTRSESGMT